jgi:hypothetical protein
MTGQTAIETAGFEQSLKFGISAIDPLGLAVDLQVVLHTPRPDPEGPGNYLCGYHLHPLEWSGEAVGSNPFHAIRLAVFKIRVELVHRFPDWQLLDPEGGPMNLDYDELA